MRSTLLILVVAAVIGGLAITATAAPDAATAGSGQAKVQFDRDIRPILAAHCFACHGPDAKQAKGGLRIDQRAIAVKAAESGKVAIVPGKPEASELVTRIFSSDPDERMPPPDAKKPLAEAEKQLLKRWIAEGAEYQKHWSYVAPVRPELPKVRRAEWCRNEIDRFILARLEAEGLSPSPEADRYTLARRWSLDLTGLPPSIEEVDRFVADRSPDAAEKLVAELMARPTYGEHWARVWLDLARYADSAGYVADMPREIWAYRDYVIRSFNANKPFDQFTLEQIAGDLLPSPTEEQIVATAFHRNTQTNNEGGSDREEYRNVAIVDRVNTTMAVWMGTTMACCQCHDHKYDPLTQKEYFQFFAILNNTEDADRSDETPVHALPFSSEQQQQRAKLQAEIDELEQKLTKKKPADQPERGGQSPFAPRTPQKGTVPGQPTDKTPAEKLHAAATTGSAAAKNDKPAKPQPDADEKRLKELKAQLAAIKPATVPIMRELAAGHRRTTHIEYRGNFLSLGPEVSGGVPAIFPPLPPGEPNRLALAHWLVDKNNPLVARVVVNRLWERVFGIGLVATSEDFGTQGELPSHPELLDWLATEFMASHWDVKHMIRLMVTSAAYRQSSRLTPEQERRDPENRLLARGPRFRLDAEAVHDQALAASGLLSPKMYGPAVRPEQPSFGLSAAFGGGMDWKTSDGEDRYRRAIYTSWRRTNPYPSMVTFDSATREVCSVRRSRTNTPLQALVVLNDPVYFEAAQALGRRMASHEAKSPAERVAYGLRLCLARPPLPEETARLAALYEKTLAEFKLKPDEAKKLAGTVGGPTPTSVDAAQTAAWTTVANVLLNLDETLMRP